MRILLLGEYSNVHWTLAQGLRALGQEVTVVSDGDRWKGYKRDIDLSRRSLGKFDTLRYLWDIERLLPRLRGYDVVQIINPVFLDLRAERIFRYYKQLRRQNGKLFLGAFGIDKLWVQEGMKPETFRYSDFFINGTERHTTETEEMKSNWLYGAKARLNDFIANDCDGIIAGLYEYYVCYRKAFAHKLHFIPFPVNHSSITPTTPHPEYKGIRFFVGVQRARSAYKGTDILLEALRLLKARRADEMEVVVAENVPFDKYSRLMDSSDVLVDQLYSYTPAMNALLAMAKGLVVVGGGEEEQYQLLGERELRPIVNVRPGTPSEIADEIERQLFSDPQALPHLSEGSKRYTRRWHDHIQVARQYLNVWVNN